jgi:glyceraldehyde 3-phosphate dehydrogenase
MAIRIAIMGFGRMGRNLFRAIYPDPDIEIVAINDIADAAAIEYLLRFDSLHGHFGEPVRVMDGYLYVGGRRIPVLHEAEPGGVPWYDYGVDVVVEATGRYRTRAELERHLDAGADRVLLTTPPTDEIDAVYIRGVSPGPIPREHRLISCGSSTANCVAVMLQTLDGAFGVEEAFFTSVHAYTTEQSLIDVPSNVNLRLSRAAVENIVPVRSWTEEFIPRLFPKLAGRFGGCKLNVPVPDTSCVDLVTTLATAARPKDINEVFRSVSGSTLAGIVDYTEEPIVSSDAAESSASCTFDALATMTVQEDMVKTLGWYAQGGGLAHRLVEVIRQLAPSMGSGERARS